MRTKAEHKKHLTQLFREEAERRGLKHVRQLHFSYPLDDQNAIHLGVVLQTNRESPHVFAIPYASARRKDYKLLQKKLGMVASGATYTVNLGYLMPDRESWHEWVFLAVEPEPGTELVDMPDYDTTLTYGCEHDTVRHLFDGFLKYGIPAMRDFTRLERVAEYLATGGASQARPMIYFLLGDCDAADASMRAVLDTHHHETPYGASYRDFAEKLYAEMGIDPPPVSTEPPPDPKPTTISERCHCTFDSLQDAESARVEFLEKGHDCVIETNEHGLCCVVRRTLPEYKIDGWQRRRVKLIAEKHRGKLLLQQLGGDPISVEAH